MPRHFPVLRLVVPIAALGVGLSFVVGIVAAVTLLVMGIAGGRPLGGLVNGLAAVAAGVGAAFSLAEALLEIHATIMVPPPGNSPPSPPAAGQAEDSLITPRPRPDDAV